MTKVGEHITLDIIGTTQEYDPSLFENVINKIAKAAKVTFLKFLNINLNHKVYNFSFVGRKSYELSYFSRKRNNKF